MKLTRKFRNDCGFTIIELLTVMSIIIILIGILVPGLTKVKRFAMKVKQRAQFYSINTALEMFNVENEGYPNSRQYGADGEPYCGAMKLAEALVGWDARGFHPRSTFVADGYIPPGGVGVYNPSDSNERMGFYLQLDNANAFRLKNLYSSYALSFTSGDGDMRVLCDVYTNVTYVSVPFDANDKMSGRSVGMPILYYKAKAGNFNRPYLNSIADNDDLVRLGMPWDDTLEHRLATDYTGIETSGEELFQVMIRDDRAGLPYRPCRVDSYILISAGFDGEYGTSDDIFNFTQ